MRLGIECGKRTKEMRMVDVVHMLEMWIVNKYGK